MRKSDLVQTLKTFSLCGLLLSGSLPLAAIAEPYASSAAELERARLSDIVTGIDQVLAQVDIASRSGASGRVQFNYDALKRDLLGRRMLIQRYVNGAWESPRDVPPLASTYHR